MDEEKKETIEEKKDDEDNTNINNKEFLEQLKAINDDDKISLEEIDTLDLGACPICYEKLQFLKYDKEEKKVKPNPNIVTTQCGHSFCFECLSTHIERKNKCPMCRTIISNKQRYRLITTYEGSFVIKQKMDAHLTHKFASLLNASDQLNDPNILLSSVKYCLYDIMQTFRRLQIIDGEADDEDDEV